MADTTYRRYVVEPVVREFLSKEFGQEFDSRVITLATGGRHEFDAVSEDGETVAAIKTAGGRTARGRNPAGKINNAIAELYYLSLSEARRRMLVLTSPQFFDILDKHMEGRLAPGIELKLISLPPEIQQKVVDIQARASAEVSKRPTQ